MINVLLKGILALKSDERGPLFGMQIIWAALVFSIFIYGAIAFTMMASNPFVQGASATPFYQSPWFLPITGYAILVFFLSSYVPRLVYRSRNGKPTIRSHVIPQFQSTNDSTSKELQKFTTPFILRLALLEAVALAGFVLCVLTAQFQAYLGYAAVALIGHFLSYPTAENLKRMMSDD